MLPERFYSLRVDSRDYTPKGRKCVADVDPSDTLKCSVKKGGEGKLFGKGVPRCNRSVTEKTRLISCNIDPTDFAAFVQFNVVGKKMFLTKVTICKPQEHIWLGFKLRKFFKHDRYGYVTNFFYPGGKWASADK
ncbi:unnamed protein product [Dibothriocephalus latus]|uniref:Uncharacterized protein n=1 Tax=Dibothriocephalus latus TaxID=60516 RepID=A0A3P6TXY8_DIBLA|nr:unnamed protein product [Dibothriocephalus latus]